MTQSSLPGRAEVVIVGGGIIGCSIAYHLAKLGITDVLLLERRQLTCGTTWHAAGLVPQLRATRNLTELARYTAELLKSLEAETGQATGFRQNGSIGVALNAGRFEELRRGASMARSFGVEVEIVTPAEIRARYPFIDAGGIVGGVWLPQDGQTNPVDTTLAFAKGAKQRGARILENVEVETILVENGRARGVRTGQGEVRAGTVVLAAGMWSHALGRKIGLRLPLQAAEHFYVVTEAIADLPRDLPVLRVPDEWAYYKEDAGKLLVGAFEPVAKPWGLQGIPKDFCFDSLPNDIEHFMPVLEKAVARVPVLANTGIQTWFNGPESFTPDDQYLLGESVEVRDLFVACGFNSIGIQSSGGAGKVLAEWIRDRRVPMDLPGLETSRMQPFQGTRAYLADRTRESLGLLYAMHWPYRQFESARGARRTPFHDRLLAAGACMGELGGWERANWFGTPGSKPYYEYSWGAHNWAAQAREECLAVRDRVALFDQSSMAKFLVQGRDSHRVLNGLGTANVDVPPGRVVYTQWLNDRGGIEADLTVTRLREDEFLVVTSVSSHARDLAHLREAIAPDAHCIVTDVTSGLPMLSLMGPASRALLEKLSGEDLSNTAFPFATSREIEIGYAIVRATRITYVGELGWELYIPAEFALHVFERIVEAGADFGLKFAGFHAMNACRIEKGYRHWGHDIGVEDTPLEAGLAFTCNWEKPGGFTGREALARQREAGAPRKRLVQLRLEDPAALVYHEEPIIIDGKIAGSVTSGMVGHRVEASLGMGWVRLEEPVTAARLAQSGIEIEVAGRRVRAQAQLVPHYDPKNHRSKDDHEAIRHAA
ncbi:MAG: FAD-dependent oxidoreductase [Proteobacteria bacterium]|nr:FAD-dependent oxidoreductase [Pseudomonadota bacterium]